MSTHRVTRRRFLKLAGAAAAAATAAPRRAAAAAPVTITWSTLATGGPAVADVYRALVQEFQRENPGIAVNLQILPGTSGEQYNRYVTVFAAKDASLDVLSIDVIWPAPMAAAGWLTPVGDRFSAAQRDAFLPGAIRANTINGKLYGVPWYTDAGLLYYRTDLLEQAGARIPGTWTELVSVAQRATAGANPNALAGFLYQGARIEALADFFFEVLWSNGGDILDPRGKVIVDNGQGVAALDFMLDLVRRYHVTPPGVTTLATDDTRIAFQAGRAVLLRNWTYAYDLFQGPGSAVAGKVGIAPLPKGAAGRASCLGGWQLAVSAYSRHRDEAWKFVEFMTGPVAQKSMAIALSTVPTRKATFQDPEVVKKAPEFPAMLQVVLTARPRPQVAEYPRLSDIVQTNLSAALAGQATSADAIARMARDIRGLLKQ